MAARRDDNYYTLNHGNMVRGNPYSELLNAVYESSKDGSALRKIPKSTDDNKIVFKQFADWARENPNEFKQTMDMWETQIPSYVFTMFPEEVTNKQNILQTIIIADPTVPDIMSRKAPNKHVHTSMTRVGTALRFYGIAFTMDYYYNEVSQDYRNGDQWSEFDLNLKIVVQSYVATRIHTIFREFTSTPHRNGGPHREFAYTELPVDVESFLRIKNAGYALLSKDQSNGFMEILRRGNEVFSRDKLVVGGILVADSLLGSAMFDKVAKIEYSKAGGNSFIADKTSNPRILPRDVTVFEVPYVQKLKHNEYDLNPFRHVTMNGSLAYYDDFYSELRSDEYRSVFRNIAYYDDVSQRRSEHNFVNGLMHSGHFDSDGHMAIGLKLEFLDPNTIVKMCDFCGSNKEEIVRTNTYDILSRTLPAPLDKQLVPCFTFGELPKERYPDYIIERMVEDCCHQLLTRHSMRTDVLEDAVFTRDFNPVRTAEGLEVATATAAEFRALQTQANDVLLVNAEIAQVMTELGTVFPWINDNRAIACAYLFRDQAFILTEFVNPEPQLPVNAAGNLYSYQEYSTRYQAHIAAGPLVTREQRLNAHNHCIGNLRVCPRFNDLYEKSKQIRKTNRFMAIVMRALIMTPIDKEALETFEKMDIRLPFGLVDLRPFEAQETKDAIVVASGAIGTSYVSEGKKFVSFSTNDQTLHFNNYVAMGALITNTNAFQYFRNIKGGARLGGKGDKYINETERFDPHRNDRDHTALHEAIAEVPLLGRNCIFASMTSHADAASPRKPVHVSVDGKFRPDQFSGYADAFPEFSEKRNSPQYEGVFFLNWFFGLHECQSFRERDVPEPTNLTRNDTCLLESFNKICSQINSQHYDPDSMDFKMEKVSHHAWGKQGVGSYEREKGDF